MNLNASFGSLNANDPCRMLYSLLQFSLHHLLIFMLCRYASFTVRFLVVNDESKTTHSLGFLLHRTNRFLLGVVFFIFFRASSVAFDINYRIFLMSASKVSLTKYTTVSCRSCAQRGCFKFQPITIPTQIRKIAYNIRSPFSLGK